ncbi:MAG: hypothetical protein AB7I59_31165 [Geminicoccaceae bacterium]
MLGGTVLALVVLGILAGCGFKPMPVPESGGIPPGPGLLTGKQGEWVILRRGGDPP